MSASKMSLDGLGLRQLLAAQIHSAAALPAHRNVPDSAMHEARKALKRSRSTLRLLRALSRATRRKLQRRALKAGARLYAARPRKFVRCVCALVDQ
jgi:hypothetical protein